MIDINIKIVPEHVFLDSRDVNISCEFNSNLVKTPQWITIRRNGLFLLHDVVIATGNKTELGEFFRDSKYRSRMEINGSVADQRVNVMMRTMECEDEAHYECVVGGHNDQGSLQMFSDSYALVVNCEYVQNLYQYFIKFERNHFFKTFSVFHLLLE